MAGPIHAVLLLSIVLVLRTSALLDLEATEGEAIASQDSKSREFANASDKGRAHENLRAVELRASSMQQQSAANQEPHAGNEEMHHIHDELIDEEKEAFEKTVEEEQKTYDALTAWQDARAETLKKTEELREQARILLNRILLAHHSMFEESRIEADWRIGRIKGRANGMLDKYKAAGNQNPNVIALEEEERLRQQERLQTPTHDVVTDSEDEDLNPRPNKRRRVDPGTTDISSGSNSHDLQMVPYHQPEDHQTTLGTGTTQQTSGSNRHDLQIVPYHQPEDHQTTLGGTTQQHQPEDHQTTLGGTTQQTSGSTPHDLQIVQYHQPEYHQTTLGGTTQQHQPGDHQIVPASSNSGPVSQQNHSSLHNDARPTNDLQIVQYRPPLVPVHQTQATEHRDEHN